MLMLVNISTILFLCLFVFGNLFGSLTEDWDIAQMSQLTLPLTVSFLLFFLTSNKILKVNFFEYFILTLTLGALFISTYFIRNETAYMYIIGYIAVWFISVMSALILTLFQNIKLNAELEKANNQKSEFISFAAHQIRTPVGNVKGLVSIAAHEQNNSEVTQIMLGNVNKIIDNVLVLIGQYLNKSKIELGTMQYTMQAIDLYEVIQECATGFEFACKEKGLALVVQKASGVDFPMQGDSSRLMEAMRNFIDNAIKYTKEGSITIYLEKAEHVYRVRIVDTGAGIEKEKLAQVFGKFVRVDVTQMNMTGSGLGLFLAKQFIEKHNGTVSIDSEGLGKGSTITIQFKV